MTAKATAYSVVELSELPSLRILSADRRGSPALKISSRDAELRPSSTRNVLLACFEEGYILTTGYQFWRGRNGRGFNQHQMQVRLVGWDASNPRAQSHLVEPSSSGHHLNMMTALMMALWMTLPTSLDRTVMIRRRFRLPQLHLLAARGVRRKRKLATPRPNLR